jgi:hypothetical protein
MSEIQRLRDELLQRFPTIEAPRSVFVETEPKRTQVVLHQAAAQLGMMITTRIIDDGALTVWRIK